MQNHAGAASYPSPPPSVPTGPRRGSSPGPQRTGLGGAAALPLQQMVSERSALPGRQDLVQLIDGVQQWAAGRLSRSHQILGAHLEVGRVVTAAAEGGRHRPQQALAGPVHRLDDTVHPVDQGDHARSLLFRQLEPIGKLEALFGPSEHGLGRRGRRRRRRGGGATTDRAQERNDEHRSHKGRSHKGRSHKGPRQGCAGNGPGGVALMAGNHLEGVTPPARRLFLMGGLTARPWGRFEGQPSTERLAAAPRHGEGRGHAIPLQRGAPRRRGHVRK